MNKKLLFFILVVFIGKNAAAQNHNDVFIAWTGYQLNWNDFKGQPGAGSIGDAGTAVAIKAKPYMEKKKIHYMVQAFFDKNKSWYRDQSPSLLAHEQLHFDIAELYARKARKRIMEIALTGEKDLKVYNNAVQKILNESNLADQQYDAETLHGSMIEKQQQWQKKISKELMDLEAYKGPRVDI